MQMHRKQTNKQKTKTSERGEWEDNTAKGFVRELTTEKNVKNLPQGIWVL